MPSSRDLPNPGIEPASLMSPALADNFLRTSTTWEAVEYTKPDQTQTNKKLERGLRREHLPQIIFSLLSRMSRHAFVTAEQRSSHKEEEGKVCKPLWKGDGGATEGLKANWRKCEQVCAQDAGSGHGVGTGHQGLA